jgi:hypothetical protein
MSALLASGSAQAQFSMVPAPLCAPPRESVQEVEQEFRIDAARHLYSVSRCGCTAASCRRCCTA